MLCVRVRARVYLGTVQTVQNGALMAEGRNAERCLAINCVCSRSLGLLLALDVVGKACEELATTIRG